MLVLSPGDALLLARNNTWLDDPLVITSCSGCTIGAYGDASLPRPLIQLPRSTMQLSTCLYVGVTGSNVVVQDIHVAGCSTGIAVNSVGSSDAGTPVSNIMVQRCFVRDIRGPFRSYSPPNPAWANGISILSANNEPVYNVTIQNNIGLRLDMFYGSGASFVNGLVLASNTVAQCGGNCVAMYAHDMVMRDSVFLRDTPATLFLYGTTDVRPRHAYSPSLLRRLNLTPPLPPPP